MTTLARLLLPALLIALLAACAPAPTAPTPAPAAPPTTAPATAGQAAPTPAAGAKPTPLNPPVTVKMGDPVFNPMAPVYIALDRGYFSEEGLDVQLVPFAADVAGEVSQVALGQLQFGMAGPDPGLFNAMERGVEIRLLASSVANR